MGKETISKDIIINILSFITPYELPRLRLNKAWEKVVKYAIEERPMPSFFKNPQDFTYKDYLRSIQLPHTFQEKKTPIHSAEIPLPKGTERMIVKDDLLVTIGEFITFYDMNTMEPVTMIKRPHDITSIKHLMLTANTLSIITRNYFTEIETLHSWDLKKNDQGLDVIFKGATFLSSNVNDKFHLNLLPELVVHPDVLGYLNASKTLAAVYCPNEGIILVVKEFLSSKSLILSAYNNKTGKEEWQVKQLGSFESLSEHEGHVFVVVRSVTWEQTECFFYDITTGSITSQFCPKNVFSENNIVSFTNRGLILEARYIFHNTTKKVVLYTNNKLPQLSSDDLKNSLPDASLLKSFAYSLSRDIVVKWLLVNVVGGIIAVMSGISITIFVALFSRSLATPNALGIFVGISFSSPSALGYSIFKIYLFWTTLFNAMHLF